MVSVSYTHLDVYKRQVPDAGLGEICTPNGRVRFVQLVGATDAELQLLLHKQLTVRQLYEKLGTDVTSYHRASLA